MILFATKRKQFRASAKPEKAERGGQRSPIDQNQNLSALHFAGRLMRADTLIACDLLAGFCWLHTSRKMHEVPERQLRKRMMQWCVPFSSGGTVNMLSLMDM